MADGALDGLARMRAEAVDQRRLDVARAEHTCEQARAALAASREKARALTSSAPPHPALAADARSMRLADDHRSHWAERVARSQSEVARRVLALSTAETALARARAELGEAHAALRVVQRRQEAAERQAVRRRDRREHEDSEELQAQRHSR